jgi:glycosyltransferase involved in cell wall biosynthesis
VGPQLGRTKAALFHGVANFDLPLAKPPATRFVLTVHDLIPLAWPDSVSRAYRFQFHAWLSHCLRLANIVICPTSAVAAALRIAFPDVPPIRVVPMGVTLGRQRWKARANPGYFLVVGSVEVRKNLTGLLKAFEARMSRWRELGIELWIAGQPGFGGAAIIAQLQDREGVKYLGSQPPRTLAGLLRGCLALCAPSFAEGFGLPPLEAMAAGIPVLASDIPAHREVLGDAAVLLSPDDTDAWSSAMLRLAEDSELGPRLGGLGRTRAARFTWGRTARQTEAVYAEVL